MQWYKGVARASAPQVSCENSLGAGEAWHTYSWWTHELATTLRRRPVKSLSYTFSPPASVRCTYEVTPMKSLTAASFLLEGDYQKHTCPPKTLGASTQEHWTPLKRTRWLGTVVPVYNLSTWEAEVGRLQV
jgi:hypothetical protein